VTCLLQEYSAILVVLDTLSTCKLLFCTPCRNCTEWIHDDRTHFCKCKHRNYV